jgi:hypothetical protein
MKIWMVMVVWMTIVDEIWMKKVQGFTLIVQGSKFTWLHVCKMKGFFPAYLS